MNLELLHNSKKTVIENNKEFLIGKSLVEFGVCRGDSLSWFHKYYSEFNIPINFMGFDSFEGLPEETKDPNSVWHKGQFSTGGVIPEIGSRPGVTLVKGWFSESLNSQAAENLGSKIGIAHIDCDTYTSTLTCWDWMLSNDLLVDGSIIIYDDWGGYRQAGCGEYEIGEAKAHKEISEKIQFEEVGSWVVDPRFYEVKVFKCRL